LVTYLLNLSYVNRPSEPHIHKTKDQQFSEHNTSPLLLVYTNKEEEKEQCLEEGYTATK